MDPVTIDLCDSDDETCTVNLVPDLPSSYSGTSEKSFLRDSVHSSSAPSYQEEERLIAECSLCNRTFHSTTTFISHMQSYHRLGNLFECTTCHQIFISQQGLSFHMDTVHSVKQACPPVQTTFSCEICGDKFHFKEALDAHIDVHTIEKKYSIVAEAVDNNETENKKFTCSICLKQFFVEGALIWHKKKKHTVIKKGRICKPNTFACDICSNVYPHKRNLLIHRSYHFRKNPVKINGSNTSLNKGADKNSITQCKKADEELVVPKLVIKLQEFSCHICGRVFPGKRSLVLHVSWHTRRSKHSQKRIGTHDNGVKLKISSRLFGKKKKKNEALKTQSSQRRLREKLHVNYFAEDMLTESEDAISVASVSKKSTESFKATQCKFCREQFRFCYNYRLHMESHKIKKNLMCNICGESFAFQSSLQTHEFFQHSAKKLLFCNFCMRPFQRKILLDAHHKSCYQISRKFTEPVPEKEIEPDDILIETCSNEIQPSPDESIHQNAGQNNLSNMLLCTASSSNFDIPNEFQDTIQISQTKGYYTCNICKTKYTREFSLLNHILIMHSIEKYPFTFDESNLSDQGQEVDPSSQEASLNPASNDPLLVDESGSSSPQNQSPPSPPSPPIYHEQSDPGHVTPSNSSYNQNSYSGIPEVESISTPIDCLDSMSLNQSLPSNCSQQNNILKAYSEYLLTVGNTPPHGQNFGNNNNQIQGMEPPKTITQNSISKKSYPVLQ